MAHLPRFGRAKWAGLGPPCGPKGVVAGKNRRNWNGTQVWAAKREAHRRGGQGPTLLGGSLVLAAIAWALLLTRAPRCALALAASAAFGLLLLTWEPRGFAARVCRQSACRPAESGVPSAVRPPVTSGGVE